MLDYRLYVLDRLGHIVRGLDFKSDSDDQALALARELSEGADAEVWQFARVVGKVSGYRQFLVH
jgi:hypothetical protein